jgi:hypothetical protein
VTGMSRLLLAFSFLLAGCGPPHVDAETLRTVGGFEGKTISTTGLVDFNPEGEWHLYPPAGSRQLADLAERIALVLTEDYERDQSAARRRLDAAARANERVEATLVGVFRSSNEPVFGFPFPCCRHEIRVIRAIDVRPSPDPPR